MAALVRQHLPYLDDRAEFDLRGVRSVIPAASLSERPVVGRLRRPAAEPHRISSRRTKVTTDFRILGPLEIHREGIPVPLRGPRLRALLAILLLHRNEVVSTDQLIEDLWSGRPPPKTKELVWVHVSRLRTALGSGVLLSRPPGYVLRVAEDELDLGRFERLCTDARGATAALAAEWLREALALWRGPPLSDIRYERFATAEIARLEELRLAAVEARIDADLVLGRHAELVGELEALVAGHPLRERLRTLLMLALYRSGRQAEALGVYQDARRELVDGFGLEPGPELKRLERAILAHDPSLQLGRAAPEARTAVPAQTRAVLAAARESHHGPRLLMLAQLMAAVPPRELIVLRVVPPSKRDDLAGEVARLREQARSAEGGPPVRIAAFASSDAAGDIVRLASQQDVELLLLEADLASLSTPVQSDVAGILASAPSDVALLVATESMVDRAGPVVVPFGAARHDWAALELGAWLAQATSAPFVLVGALGSRNGTEHDASRLLADASIIVQRCGGIVAEPVLTNPGPEGFLAAASDAGLLVIGLSDHWPTQGLGATRRTIAGSAVVPILFVRRGVRPGGLAPSETRTRFTWSLASAAAN
jgi:DNA-binding SARP family transcriptional activator